MTSDDAVADPPPRPWTDSGADLHDAAILIKHVPTPGRDVARWLAEHPGQHHGYVDIARGLGLAHETGLPDLADAVAAAVWTIGEFCGAFRMTPLVAVVDGRCAMTPSDAHIVIAALDLLDTYLENQC